MSFGHARVSGRSYGALSKGRSPELEALKRADEIFLSRAMNKKWRKMETEESAVRANYSTLFRGEEVSRILGR